MTEFRDRVQRAVADLEILSSNMRLTTGETVFRARLLTVSLAFDLNISKRWPQ
jgi:hypothetical protein